MSLRTKVLSILLIIIAIYTSLVYLSQRVIIFPSFISLEQNEAKKDMERCVEAIQREIHHLDLFTHDWAAWDDTYEFAKNRNNEYIDSNLVEETFTDQKLNLIYYVNEENEIVWGKIVNLETEETIQMQDFPATGSFPEKHPLIAYKTNGVSLDMVTIKGIFMTTQGP